MPNNLAALLRIRGKELPSPGTGGVYSVRLLIQSVPRSCIRDAVFVISAGYITASVIMASSFSPNKIFGYLMLATHR
jgi:hypothetical protein